MPRPQGPTALGARRVRGQRGVMDILVTEAEPGDATELVERLAAAGHRVATCHRPGLARCVGLEAAGGCPLTPGRTDVVVDVRRRPVGFTERELGALCAVRADVPLVVVGPTPAEPGPWRDADAVTDEAAAAAAIAAARSPVGPTARRRVEQAVRAVVRHYGLPPAAGMALYQRGHAVDVFLRFDRRISPMVREELRMSVRTALAPLTAAWPYAHVVIADVTTGSDQDST
jgi:hypothetical protein